VSDAPPPAQSNVRAVVGLGLALFLASISHAMVVTSIPQIVGELGGVDHYSWILASYLLAQTVSVALWGKLSDMYGRRPLLVLGLGCFIVGCLVAAFAQSFATVVGGRVFQGLGAGCIVPVAFATLADMMQPRARAKWQGYFGTSVVVSSLLGPGLGGLIADAAGWRWVFIFQVPLAAAALVVVWTGVKLDLPRRQHALDVVGAALLAGALIPLLLAISMGGRDYPWGSGQILGLAGGGLVVLFVFGRWEQHAVEPILPLGLFRNRTFAAAQIGIFTVGAGVWTAQTFVPLLAQGGLGISAASSGLMLVPFTAAVGLSSMLAGQFVSRTGRLRPVLFASPLVLGTGFALLAWPTHRSIDAPLVAALVVAGVGAGLGGSMFLVAVQNAVSKSVMGVASGASHFSRVFAGALMLPVLGALFADRLYADVGDSPGSRVLGQLSPQRLLGAGRGLPPAAAAELEHAFASATPIVFVVLLPLFAIALVSVFFIDGRELAPGEDATPVAAASPETGETLTVPAASRVG
jgi:EmrB/QacA subfamily drug resistance transporter